MLLKDLILNNPELPFILIRNNDEDRIFLDLQDIFEDIEGEIGEIFRHGDFPDKTFFDRDELKDAIYEKSPNELSDEELEAEAAKYATYWKKCIVLEI